MSEDDWENDWNDYSNKTINMKPNYVDIQTQVRLLEIRDMEEKADNQLMNDLFSDNAFKIHKDNSDINSINSSNKKINKNNKLVNDNYKIKNYYKNKNLNDNKKQELNKIKQNKKIKNKEKNDIFGNYEDDNLDIYSNIEDKYLK
jgi:hypothetical protein